VEIPSGLDHLKMLAVLSEGTRQESEPKLKEYARDLRVIGTSLSALYLAATCHRKCHGGPHILESLTGRAYNLGCGAYILICRAFYDEALNLVRSMGEISNLVLLSVVDKNSLRKWLEADRKTRLTDFSPVKVRKLLEAQSTPMIADKDWYASFCDRYTHISPATKPNLHNDVGLPHAGGVFQPAGLRHSLSELATVLGSVAMPICKYFKLDDVLDELLKALDSGREDEGSAC
jgi:hypothetical protein